MKTREEKIRKRDDALLKQEASMRRSRIGAIGFAILIPLVAIVLAKESPSPEHTRFWTVAFFFTIALACYYDVRIKHIDSVKMYREKLGEQTVFPRNPDHQIEVYWDCPKCDEKNISNENACRKCGFQAKPETEPQPANPDYRASRSV